MPSLGVAVAIIDAGRILLTKREDFEVWCLPSGGVDPGESVAQAAVREAREETGLEVGLTRLVGIYSRPRWNHEGFNAVLFAAVPVGGTLQPAPAEVLELRYFDPQELPYPILWHHRQEITDALSGIGGSITRSHDASWPFVQGMSRQELYEMRDRSGLPRQEFYLRYLEWPSTEDEKWTEDVKPESKPGMQREGPEGP